MTKRRWMIGAAIFIMAINLRCTFLAITPLLKMVATTYHLTSSQVGWLTTIPLLVFAVGSTLVGAIAARMATGPIMVASFVIMLIGEGVRYIGGLEGLYIGTFLLGCGIVSGNVLLPAIISAYFPDKVGIMTSTYTCLMQVATGTALATITPLASIIGWEEALLTWGIPTVVGLCIWLPLLRLDIRKNYFTKPGTCKATIANEDGNQIIHKKPSIGSIFRNALAWHVSIFMGIQSLTFYSLMTWLPSILMDKGLSSGNAGFLLFFFKITSLVTTFFLPMWLRHYKEQKCFAASLCVMYILGIGLLYYIKGFILAFIATTLVGIAAGGVFVIAMLYFVIRTNTPEEAALLSGAGQSIGYILAAIAPVLIGYLYDASQGWASSLLFLAFCCIIFAYTGYCGGKNKKIKI